MLWICFFPILLTSVLIPPDLWFCLHYIPNSVASHWIDYIIFIWDCFCSNILSHWFGRLLLHQYYIVLILKTLLKKPWNMCGRVIPTVPSLFSSKFYWLFLDFIFYVMHMNSRISLLSYVFWLELQWHYRLFWVKMTAFLCIHIYVYTAQS